MSLNHRQNRSACASHHAEKGSLTIEITGGEEKIEKFITLMRDFGIIELTRTGQVALPRA